jgi:small subunit ribosomal protein S16
MAVKLRLKCIGRKGLQSYRIVAMNNLTRRDGRPIRDLGFYNPRTKETKLDVKFIKEYLGTGAQPTQTVKNILVRARIL